MKLSKKLIGALCSVFLVMSMLPTAAFAADPILTDVVIHKLKVDSGTALQDHDGKEITGPLDTLSGIEFKYWTISPTATEAEMTVIKGLTTLKAIEDYATANPTVLYSPVATAATGADGSVTLTNMAEGKYIFAETNGAANNVSEYIGVPFLLELPAMHTDGTAYFGTGANALHVYPKNVVTDGGMDVQTVDKATGAQIGGGSFRFEVQNSDSTWSPVDGFTAGLDITTGYKVLENLPAGTYRLVNTVAPDGYLIDDRPVTFTVSGGTVTVDTSANPNSEFQPTGGVGGNPLIIFKFVAEPNIDKTIDGEKEQTYQVGDTITWTIDLEIPSGIEDYNLFDLVDNIDPRLDFEDNLVVKLSDGTPLVKDTHYTYSFTPGATSSDKGEFRITFAPTTLENYVGKTIVASYDTVINETAEMGEIIYNEVSLDFDNGHGAETDPSDPIEPTNPPGVWTGGAKFAKVNDGATPLPGAEFKIATDAAGTTFIKWTQALIDANAVGITAGTFETPAIGSDIVMISGSTGLFQIRGLAGGTYYLVETKAPTLNGTQYNLLREPASFVVSKTSYEDTNTMDVINKSGLQIPQTGGIGTVIFTVVGLSLMGLAIALLRKKKNKNAIDVA